MSNLRNRSCRPASLRHHDAAVEFISPQSPGMVVSMPSPAYDHDGEGITRLVICKPDGTQQRQVQRVPGHGGEILWLGNDRVICSARDSLRYAVISLDGAQSPHLRWFIVIW